MVVSQSQIKIMQHTRIYRGCPASLHRGMPPPLNSAEKWFEFTDKHSTGYVRKQEVLNSMFLILRPSSRFEERFIRGKIDDSWTIFCSNGTKVSKQGFLRKKMNTVLIGVEKEYINKFDNSRRQQPQQQQGSMDSSPFGNAASRRDLLQDTSRNSAKNLMKNARNIFGGTKPKLTNQQNIPSLITSPKLWFDHFDEVNRGYMNKQQIINGLIATHDANTSEEQAVIIQSINNIWDRFVFVSRDDRNISKFEFLLDGGLANTLKHMDFKAVANNTSLNSNDQRSSYEPPSFVSERVAWFDYFDTDDDSCLTQQEVTHGLIVSLQAEGEIQQNNIRNFIEQVWPVFTGSTIPNTPIRKNTFLNRNGLADAIIESMNYLKQEIDIAPPLEKQQQQQQQPHKPGGVQIQVNIPPNMSAGQRLKIQSPRTNEIIVLTIPEQSKWFPGTNGTSYYFVTTL